MAGKTSDFPVKQRQLNEDVQTGDYKPCYLIYGEEAYLRLQNRDKLLKGLGITGNSMNFNRYGKDSQPAQIIDMAETMPFLADKRVILIEDSGFFKSGCPELAGYLKNPSETTLFLFVESEVDKRKDIYKAASKLGFEMECTVQDEEMLKRWLRSKFQAEGKSISPGAQSVLLDRVGTDMSNLSTEIEKLVCYCIDRGEIKEGDIEAVCANYLTSSIFAMTDAISGQEKKKAMEVYYDLIALKEPPARILSLITRQFNLMIRIKEMTDNKRDRRSIAQSLKLADFVVGKYQNWARSYTYEQLRQALEICASCDEAVKSGRLSDVISVEMVIIGCTSFRRAV
ncbi:MAG: DNA polymerase III subunit delta [Butyrivibrio sp.]|nr:DNA polymerase III subunit delta [Butyrivibrio sp.]